MPRSLRFKSISLVPDTMRSVPSNCRGSKRLVQLGLSACMGVCWGIFRIVALDCGNTAEYVLPLPQPSPHSGVLVMCASMSPQMPSCTPNRTVNGQPSSRWKARSIPVKQ